MLSRALERLACRWQPCANVSWSGWRPSRNAGRNHPPAPGRRGAQPETRAIDPLTAWRRILDALPGAAHKAGERPAHIEFLRLDREAGTDRDVALLSHLLDPTQAFIETIARPAHGMLVTSATLRDGIDNETAWEGAEARTGAAHLPAPAIRAAFDSPFDYAERTRIVLVSDVNGQDLGQLAGAYQALFQAAGGGGLGLFTAISRLRAVHTRIAPKLEAMDIPLYAQHVDALENATLVDIFRAEENSCLLGTDAMRDGVDIPGNALAAGGVRTHALAAAGHSAPHPARASLRRHAEGL